jgi:hypothetical protein
MHAQTPDLAREVRKARAYDDQIDLLHDRFAGETCVIVTCGPSLGTVPADELRRRLQGRLAISIKQAIDVIGAEADFQCWNPFNVTKFAVPSTDTIRCLVGDPSGRFPQFNDYDIEFPTVNTGGRLDTSLAATNDYGNHLLADHIPRPFGPGIMHELVLYLAVHLGVSEIITIGWDIANASGMNTHFYDDSDDRDYFERGRVPASATTSMRRHVPDAVRLPMRRLRTRRDHHRGVLYNRTTSQVGETELVAQSTGPLEAWLREIGVGLTVTTDSEYLDPAIRRVTVDELFDLLDSR